MENLKIMSCDNYWVCENMDISSPILEQGTIYLLSDGTKRTFKDGFINDEHFEQLEWATLDEKKQYASKIYGYIFKGDKVIINRGRKMRGEIKTVKGYYRYDVRGTSAKEHIDYLIFTDDTKVNIKYCDVVGVEHKNFKYNGEIYYYRTYQEEFKSNMLYKAVDFKG